MKRYDVSRLPSTIELGYDGENNWRPNSFDCSSLLKNHPNGVISLWLLPQGESQAFPVAVQRDGNVIVWTPLNEEMTTEYGSLQIQCDDGTDVGKSAVVMFRVSESIVPGAEHPAAVPSWATQVMEQMQSAVEHYPTIIDGTWHVWDVDNETWEDTGVSAQGVDGEDGHSPYIALNGHWMVYSDATGEWIDTGVSAAVDEAVIANAVAAYLDEHPIQVTETDPTVPQWAKAPDKPTYTAQEIGALPSDTVIPPAVTEQTVAEWGFTKNTGDYSKPSGGIPKTDLAEDVKTSLGKADTALQEHQSLAGYATETYVQQQIDAIPDELPTVSASDNGKVLGVANGTWNVVPPANALVIDFNNPYASAYDDVKAAMQGNREVYLSVPNSASNPTECIYLRASAWNATHITFGGLSSAYLPGGYFIMAYAHITSGTSNWFKWTTRFYFNPVLFQHLAPPYDSTATYSVGDYVTYGDNSLNTSSVYRCTTAITVAEEWNASHWTAVTVMGEITAVDDLPSVSASDNGKFLRVVSGAWTAATVPAAESNSFGGGT